MVSHESLKNIWTGLPLFSVSRPVLSRFLETSRVNDNVLWTLEDSPTESVLHVQT